MLSNKKWWENTEIDFRNSVSFQTPEKIFAKGSVEYNLLQNFDDESKSEEWTDYLDQMAQWGISIGWDLTNDQWLLNEGIEED
jgi:hypothetical protein